ncbi:hypothetical protein MPDQ_001169 [Monascus purpureus]|uniref:Protein kinase domain-containing protein n=1 Tax=Monascus purpureus TaxID=5098 RepID=A0A507R4S3_MONPU|nr:hypothetical protein MPDQ_001169 [Monascus purpureus]BDD61435.1 hypothetical protein MAP00_006479 [Monascus purpureus]
MADKTPGQEESPYPDSVQRPPYGAFDRRPFFQRKRPARYASAPIYDSPQRHHRRNPIVRRPVKETLDAHSEYYTSQDDGTAEHKINQYVIKQEIGRGSFGAVHLAVDQFGNEYAVKEFSKSRLRKRAQSYVLRRTRGSRRPGSGFNSPLHRHPSESCPGEEGNAFHLIKQEIAIMKKLNHSNLVSLIEVLDDPTEDSLYMVMEMCKKGVIMKVGLDERADPYDDERCRCWFRDLILGIEYLHAQGIVHRDIKPDNCLLTGDDVLKVVDFGVSEMFEKDSNMYTAKSAGSPAFLPPELCVAKHGDVSGRAADIWSMGVTLYCLRYGRLPFERQSIFDLYEAIRSDPVVCEGETDENFKDLMYRILEKDPVQRITMPELREHPWVTKNGMDPLLPEEENTAEIIGLPTEEEMNSAITMNIGRILTVMKAVKQFKRLLGPDKADPPMQSILGQDYEAHFVQPPLEMEPEESFAAIGASAFNKSQSLNMYNREHPERDFVLSGYHDQHLKEQDEDQPPGPDSVPTRQDSDNRQNFGASSSSSPKAPLSRASSAATKHSVEGGTRGHARDPLEEEHLYLFIGPSTFTGTFSEAIDSTPDGVFEEPDSWEDGTLQTPGPGLSVDHTPIVSESPGAADFDIYETAYKEQIENIRKRRLTRRETGGKLYLTRRVENKDHMKKLVEELPQDEDPASGPVAGIGEKRAVPPVTPIVGLVQAQLKRRRESSKLTNQTLKEQPFPSSSVLTPTENTASAPGNPIDRL